MSKDKSFIASKLILMPDFNHSELVLTGASNWIEPITIEENYFQILIPCEGNLEYVLNDAIIVSSLPLWFVHPNYNSTITCGSKRTSIFKSS
jgi:hypothetical protein